MITDTIVAIATSLQTQAISIIRLSGNESIQIASTLLKKDLSKVESHTIHYGFIHDDDKTVDEVLVSVFLAPKTYTREDVVEINCHGGVYLTKYIYQLCLVQGAREARNGEFLERAFLNGRIDLTQAESVMDLVESRYEEEAHLAVSGVKGSIKQKILTLKDDLIQIIAMIEVNIDYPEYDDVEELTIEKLRPKTIELNRKINELLIDSKQGSLIKDGIKVAIIGKPNVGKSSLLNALLQENKAIVTDIAGTTRDIVEGEVIVGGVKLQLLDTAGIRQTHDKVEAIGIEKSKQVLDDADLVLLVFDSSRELDHEDEALRLLVKEKKFIEVYNKTDLTRKQGNRINISAKEDDLSDLTNQIKEMYQLNEINNSKVLISNVRHITLLKRAKVSLEEAIQSMDNGLDTDFIIVDLTDAFYQLNSILGEESKVDLLDEIFRRFCLGK